MQQKWRRYSDKFIELSAREQGLIILTGLVLIFMAMFSGFIEDDFAHLKKQALEVRTLTEANKSTQQTITLLEQHLLKDPNVTLQQQIDQQEERLAEVDQDLLTLTSDLIDPIQMRYALLELLKLQAGVKLITFEVLPAEPLLIKQAPEEKEKGILARLTTEKKKELALGLYRHRIKLTLHGKYFQLRDYLSSLEGLSWTFFWQQFQYKALVYPQSELEIEIYSLSTKQEFIGV